MTTSTLHPTGMPHLGQQQATVYLIEDDPTVRQAVRILSESIGFLVQEFESAEDFLGAATDDSIGCIVADVCLQGMSGIELLESIRVSQRPRPFVIITGYATTEKVVRAMRSGAVTVLDKPFDPAKLSTAIRQAVNADELQRAKAKQLVDLRARFELLTDQERVVLQLIIDGHINKEISKQLDVSVRTVETRRQHIFKKTGAKNLGELLWYAIMLRTEGYDWSTCGNPAPEQSRRSANSA